MNSSFRSAGRSARFACFLIAVCFAAPAWAADDSSIRYRGRKNKSGGQTCLEDLDLKAGPKASPTHLYCDDPKNGEYVFFAFRGPTISSDGRKIAFTVM